MGVRGFRVDASKHMWPGDLEAIQGMTQDIGGGGRPLFFHEVIDMGGEAISSNEYLGVGKVTEFRYGLKMAQCIRTMTSTAWEGSMTRGGAWLMACMPWSSLTTTTTREATEEAEEC